MIDRDTETSTYAEMCVYLGRISYLGRFGNGRVEGFLDGFKACTLEEMRGLEVVKEVKKVHEFAMKGDLEIWDQFSTWVEEAEASMKKKVRSIPDNDIRA